MKDDDNGPDLESSLVSEGEEVIPIGDTVEPFYRNRKRGTASTADLTSSESVVEEEDESFAENHEAGFTGTLTNQVNVVKRGASFRIDGSGEFDSLYDPSIISSRSTAGNSAVNLSEEDVLSSSSEDGSISGTADIRQKSNLGSTNNSHSYDTSSNISNTASRSNAKQYGDQLSFNNYKSDSGDFNDVDNLNQNLVSTAENSAVNLSKEDGLSSSREDGSISGTEASVVVKKGERFVNNNIKKALERIHEEPEFASTDEDIAAEWFADTIVGLEDIKYRKVVDQYIKTEIDYCILLWKKGHFSNAKEYTTAIVNEISKNEIYLKDHVLIDLCQNVERDSELFLERNALLEQQNYLEFEAEALDLRSGNSATSFSGQGMEDVPIHEPGINDDVSEHGNVEVSAVIHSTEGLESVRGDVDAQGEITSNNNDDHSTQRDQSSRSGGSIAPASPPIKKSVDKKPGNDARGNLRRVNLDEGTGPGGKRAIEEIQQANIWRFANNHHPEDKPIALKGAVADVNSINTNSAASSSELVMKDNYANVSSDQPVAIHNVPKQGDAESSVTSRSTEGSVGSNKKSVRGDVDAQGEITSNNNDDHSTQRDQSSRSGGSIAPASPPIDEHIGETGNDARGNLDEGTGPGGKRAIEDIQQANIWRFANNHVPETMPITPEEVGADVPKQGDAESSATSRSTQRDPYSSTEKDIEEAILRGEDKAKEAVTEEVEGEESLDDSSTIASDDGSLNSTQSSSSGGSIDPASSPIDEHIGETGNDARGNPGDAAADANSAALFSNLVMEDDSPHASSAASGTNHDMSKQGDAGSRAASRSTEGSVGSKEKPVRGADIGTQTENGVMIDAASERSTQRDLYSSTEEEINEAILRGEAKAKEERGDQVIGEARLDDSRTIVSKPREEPRSAKRVTFQENELKAAGTEAGQPEDAAHKPGGAKSPGHMKDKSIKKKEGGPVKEIINDFEEKVARNRAVLNEQEVDGKTYAFDNEIAKQGQDLHSQEWENQRMRDREHYTREEPQPAKRNGGFMDAFGSGMLIYLICLLLLTGPLGLGLATTLAVVGVAVALGKHNYNNPTRVETYRPVEPRRNPPRYEYGGNNIPKRPIPHAADIQKGQGRELGKGG